MPPVFASPDFNPALAQAGAMGGATDQYNRNVDQQLRLANLYQQDQHFQQQLAEQQRSQQAQQLHQQNLQTQGFQQQNARDQNQYLQNTQMELLRNNIPLAQPEIMELTTLQNQRAAADRMLTNGEIRPDQHQQAMQQIMPRLGMLQGRQQQVAEFNRQQAEAQQRLSPEANTRQVENPLYRDWQPPEMGTLLTRLGVPAPTNPHRPTTALYTNPRNGNQSYPELEAAEHHARAQLLQRQGEELTARAARETAQAQQEHPPRGGTLTTETLGHIQSRVITSYDNRLNHARTEANAAVMPGENAAQRSAEQARRNQVVQDLVANRDANIDREVQSAIDQHHRHLGTGNQGGARERPVPPPSHWDAITADVNRIASQPIPDGVPVAARPAFTQLREANRQQVLSQVARVRSLLEAANGQPLPRHLQQEVMGILQTWDRLGIGHGLANAQPQDGGQGVQQQPGPTSPPPPPPDDENPQPTSPPPPPPDSTPAPSTRRGDPGYSYQHVLSERARRESSTSEENRRTEMANIRLILARERVSPEYRAHLQAELRRIEAGGHINRRHEPNPYYYTDEYMATQPFQVGSNNDPLRRSEIPTYFGPLPNPFAHPRPVNDGHFEMGGRRRTTEEERAETIRQHTPGFFGGQAGGQ